MTIHIRPISRPKCLPSRAQKAIKPEPPPCISAFLDVVEWITGVDIRDTKLTQ